MAATVLDGNAIAARVRAEVRAEVEALAARGVVPGLAIVRAGDDDASTIYVRGKLRACAEVGIQAAEHRLPAGGTQDELVATVRRLCEEEVDGVIVQLPLPAGLDAAGAIDAIDPARDVDGLRPDSLGLLWAGRPRFVPCTPAGIMRLIAEANVPVEGEEAVVIGRSAIVGKPVAALLLHAHATVTLCHSRTRDLAAHVRRASIVVAAAGRPHLVRGDCIRPGATVIDVGIHRTAAGLCGDVDFETARGPAGAITPVPGGVGPMTVAMLCANVARAATMRRGG